MDHVKGRESLRLAELREKAVPAARCRQIDRDFSAKCDYLLGLGVLAAPHARVLKRLHKYRNEAYHRDHLRKGTLASATRIYAYLVCSLMRDFPMHSLSYQSADPPAGLLSYLAADERGMALWDLLPGLQARIASRLLEETGLAHQSGVGEVLSQHLCDRLDAVREAAKESAAFFWPGVDEGGDWEAALGLAQLDLRNLRRLPSADEARSASVPVCPEHIGQWRADGEALAAHGGDLAAFAAFADLEDTFEPLEALVMQLLTHVEIQRDLASGK